MENKFLKLTSAVYKLLEFFPEADPLKSKAKEKALVIMENLLLVSGTNDWASFQKDKVKIKLLEEINLLLGYLWIGKSRGWLSDINYLIISNEYENIKNGMGLRAELIKRLPAVETSLEVEPPKAKRPDLEPISGGVVAKKERTSSFISERQGKILEFLKQKEKAQVMDLQTILPSVTKRTIRRDLDELLGMGKISRMGDFNQVSYKINDGRTIGQIQVG